MHCAKCFFFESRVGDAVCNRCGRAYLPEANVYLGLLVLVTGGVAWTLRHLLTGQVDPFVRPAVDLGAWGAWPVSIVDRPAYGLVLGGWLGMMAVTPVLTGMMYGKRGGWLLSLLLALLGPSVPLAAAVAVGVWIGAGQTLRLSSKLASALLGVLPAVVYLFVATALTDFAKGEAASGGAGAAALAPAGPYGFLWGRSFPPALRAVAYVPPVVATVVAAAAAALVVAIGRADRWHVRWPGSVLTVLTAGPVLALVAVVGIDEVRYGLVLGPAPPAEPWSIPARSETGRLRAFLAHHPRSPRADRVRARLAERLARSGGGPRTGRAEALGIWQEVLAYHPQSPYAADAYLHLGDAAAENGLFDPAEAHWRRALDRADAFEPPAEDPLAGFSVVWDLLTVGGRLRARHQADRLADLRQAVRFRLAVLDENRTGTPAGSRALALYVRAVALAGRNPYREALVKVREADPDGALADNVAFHLAMLVPDEADRIEALEAVAETWPDGDGALLAHLRAAQGLVARAESDPGALRAARSHLLRAQHVLAARKRRNPGDWYAAALGDRVEKELVYVQAELRAPASEQ